MSSNLNPTRAAVLLAASLLPFTVQAETTSLNYSDFSSVAGLQINGNASQQGDKLNLTPALTYQSGSAFSVTPITLSADASFSSAFSFEILNRGGLGGGADGLVFVVQTNANNVGGSGGGIGYYGIANSVGVEFDTYDNGEYGGSNHVGIDLNGSVNSVVSTPPLSPDFDNGEKWYAWVDYNGATKELAVRWAQTNNRPTVAGLSYTVDLPSVLGSNNAYVGFTSGTGAGWGEHNVLSWAFVNEYKDGGVTPVPEPASWALMLGGLGVLGTVARRRAR
jgi:hypothetical protein